MSWKGTGTGSYRYGSCSLWVLDDDLSGSGAHRFADRVELHFRTGEAALVVDLRHVTFIDSAGAAALSRLVRSHPGLRLVGRPVGWSDLPVAVRRSLLDLDAAPRLEVALAPFSPLTAPAEQRRHPRIPLHLPVELFVGGNRAPAALRDISRGGVHLSLIPERCLAALRSGESFRLLALASDPLAQEIAPGCADNPIPVAPVRAEAAATCGARFSGNPPPV